MLGLSWQYHYRRSELWQLAFGELDLIRSQTDEETKARRQMELPSDGVIFQTGERHRLVGVAKLGSSREIWIAFQILPKTILTRLILSD